MAQHAKQPALGVLADDFTGALDAGVEFVRGGFSVQFQITPSAECSADVLVVSSESRNRSAGEARALVAETVARLHGRRLFKKIDSTMRGHIGAEIEVVLAAAGIAHAVICPAALEAGRTVVAGQLLLQGVPIHQTAFRRDPHWPAITSSMLELIGVAATHVPSDIVRAGRGALQAMIEHSPTSLLSVDAQSQADLNVIAGAVRASGSLPCGALGLARAWGRAYTTHARSALRALEPPVAPALILVGSRHPRSLAQLQALVATGRAEAIEVPARTATFDGAGLAALVERACAVLLGGRALALHTPGFDLAGLDVQQDAMRALADIALRVCQHVQPGLLVIAGGETAQLAGIALGIQAVDIQGDVEVGVPWSIIRGGVADGVALVTKAGGFGDERVLARVLGQP